MKKAIDFWSLLVIVMTFIFFSMALTKKGFTHDVLLEAGVFLISLKIILMSYKNRIMSESIQKKLDDIQAALQRK